MGAFAIDIFITYQQDFYNETGLHVIRTKQLHYTAFDDKTAEAIIQSVRHALVMAGCTVLNTAKVLKPIQEVLEEGGT